MQGEEKSLRMQAFCVIDYSQIPDALVILKRTWVSL
jgi:hypothetical protein